MSDTVIKVENLSKQYRIGAKEGYRTFRETLVDAAKAPILKLRDAVRIIRNSMLRAPSSSHAEGTSLISASGPMPSSHGYEYIWALKNVSFEVKRGEVVGIIGRNGAGKSTLLKVLSKITEPTEGRVELKGRIGSLLEVGTGFHPELTGHENVYLYGAILGMNRWEVTRKFDEIVTFAGLEKFIDTPVKRYSSGMYMRLAFSVAAHLEPEILLVDEVLAVGDAAFQKKCLGKMGDVSKEGRTVLFVSHNMAAIENLCLRAFLLEQGHIVSDDLTGKTIASYMSLGIDMQEQDLSDFSKRKGSGDIRIINIGLRDADDRSISVAQCGAPIKIVLRFKNLQSDFNQRINVSISCKTLTGAPVFLQHNRMSGVNFQDLPEDGEFICGIRNLNLTPSTYLLSASIMVSNDYIDEIPGAFKLTVEGGAYLGGGEIPPTGFGPCVMKANWRLAAPLH